MFEILSEDWKSWCNFKLNTEIFKLVCWELYLETRTIHIQRDDGWIKTSIEDELKFIWINNDVSNATILHEVRKEN